MKKINYENPLILFTGGALLSGAVFIILNASLSKTSFLYGFLFRFWPIQVLSTWLFAVAILFVIARYLYFREEREVLNKIRLPQFTISYKDASELIETIPAQLNRTICFRRISEILKGYLSREDVISLNEELSRRDIAQIDRGHLILNSMREIIPVVGFLGTVIGLSLGMAKFPQIVSGMKDIEGLRNVLKDFAISLSVAFDTTLLALGYTIIVVLYSSILRGREETLVTEVDEKAREVMAKLRSMPEGHVQGVAGDSKDIDRAEEPFQVQFQHGLKEIVEVLHKNGNEFLKRLEEIRDGIHKPPRYKINVQPVEGEGDVQ